MSLSRLIRQSTKSNSIIHGKAIHARIIASGSTIDVQIQNHLLTMYSKFGCIDYARKLFDQMLERNLVTWTSLISAYSRIGQPEESINCFRSMIRDGAMNPNEYTYVAAISACAQAESLRYGKEIHGRIIRTEESVNCFVNNCLVNFYGKCGCLKSARVVFDAMPEINTVSCVSLMNSYVQFGDYEEGLRIFLKSLKLGVRINEFLYGCILGICAALEILEIGRQMQCLAVKFGVRNDQFIVTNLVNFYAKCGELESASRAMREADEPNVTAWTALIGGSVQMGRHEEAIRIFREMVCVGLKPSEQTFASVFGALGKERDVRGGMQLHCLIIKMGFESFTFVSNSVMAFYAKIDCLNDSLKTFYAMNVRDNVSWNALIAGYVNAGCYEYAISVIRSMLDGGFDPDIYTYSSLLSICGNLPAIEWGKQTHCCILKPGLDYNVVVGSALVDMYAKCGRLNDARKVFDVFPCKNLVSWNAMITGYAQHGFGREALEIYGTMLRSGIKPNDVTFLGVLSSCGHTGSIEEALYHFDSMTNDFGITPRADHLACIVSLFARKGQTKEACEIIRSFPNEATNKVVWRCLLSGSVINNDLEMATYAAKMILSIDPNDTSAPVILSNIYADSNMWSEASHVRELIEVKTVKKETGYSWI